MSIAFTACVANEPIDPARDGGMIQDMRDAGLGSNDAGWPDAASDADGGEALPLVRVQHERELRGVWIATVSNINFPSRRGLSPDALRSELQVLVDAAVAVNLNALFFQVRPESDALYASALEPWSRYLTGTQGQDPQMDPLAYLIEIAHAAGIEVHAWLNPYRAKTSRSNTAVAPHISVTAPEHAHVYGDLVWMDPAAEVVRANTVAVIEDIVRRYAVDGIHFDDYFYPYPDGTPFPDDATFATYQAGGGTLSRGDWRRDNVHQLVEAVSVAVAKLDTTVRFGISPFGIYRPGIPEGIVGLDQYAEIYADPVRWIDEGWVDYLAPQLYWPSTQTRQAYGPLIEWWSSLSRDGRNIFAGNYLSQLGSSASWTVDEIREQIALSRMQRAAGSLGNIFFHIGPILEDRAGIRSVFREELYPRPALTPPVAAAPADALSPPDVVLLGSTISISHPSPTALRAWVVYRESDGEHVVERIHPATVDALTLSPGVYVVTAADRFGRESEGRQVTVD